MNEGKAETITIEDESQSEDDNSEELYQPVFMRTEETCPFASINTFCPPLKLTRRATFGSAMPIPVCYR